MPRPALLFLAALSCSPIFGTSFNTYSVTAYTPPIPEFTSPGRYSGMAAMSIIILPDPELKQTIGADAVLSYNISIGGFTMFGDGCDNGQGGISPVCGFSNYQAFGGTLNYQVFYSLDGNMPNDVEVFGSPGDTYLLTAPDGFSVTAWADVSYFFPVETGSGGFPGSVTVEVDVTGNSEELPEPATGFLVVISLVFLGWLHNRTNMATITRRFRLRPN